MSVDQEKNDRLVQLEQVEADALTVIEKKPGYREEEIYKIECLLQISRRDLPTAMNSVFGPDEDAIKHLMRHVPIMVAKSFVTRTIDNIGDAMYANQTGQVPFPKPDVDRQDYQPLFNNHLGLLNNAII